MVDGPRVYVGGSYSFNPDPSLSTQKHDPGQLRNVSFNFMDTTSGSQWSPWLNMSGGVDGPVNAVAKYGDKIFVGGSFTTVGTPPQDISATNMAIWDPGYKRWERSISASILGTITALTLKGFDLYAGGPFRQKSDPNDPLDQENHLAKLGSRGWHLVDGVVNGTILDAFAVDDEIVAAGDFITADGHIGVNIVRWNESTESWTALTPGSGVASQEDIAYVSAVAGNNDRLYVGGKFNVVDTFETPHVACWERSSGTWRALGDGLDGIVRALAVDDQGRVFAGGNFSHSGNAAVSRIAMWDGDDWRPLGDGVEGQVNTLVADGDRLYVGGKFYRAGNLNVANVATWNIADSTWEKLGAGLDSDFLPSVETLALQRGKLFAGGMFDHSGTDSIKRVARWDGWKWTKLGSGTNWGVWSMAIRDGDVFVAGPFDEAGSKPSPYIALWHDPTLSVEMIDEPVAGSPLQHIAPNPAVGRAMISVDMPRGVAARIVVCDGRGTVVNDLFDGRLPRGRTELVWNPSGDVPPGVYYVRLTTDRLTITRSVVLF
jgi:hypothetical protein